jgi:YegS/Rv2252/BmrU family lipid kinase
MVTPSSTADIKPQTRYHVLLNTQSGTADAAGLTAEVLRERFELAGYDATIDADATASFAERVARALDSDAEIIVSAGGDGTATALATAIVGTDKTLGILPLGTANLLARDLGLPLDLEEAITGLGTMEPRRIDVGEVNGRVFLHKVVIGFVPGIAAAREQIRGRTDLDAEVGFLRYFIRRLARARRIAVEITPSDAAPRVERAQSVAVANNEYVEGFNRIFSRQRLDAGMLHVYVLRHLNFGDLVRLIAEMFLGNWRQDEAIGIEKVSAVTIRLRKKMIKVMVDGEVETLDTPLNFKIRPRALSVLAPPQDSAGTEAEQAEPNGES